MSETKKIGIWGATGSIGKQTLEIIEIYPDKFCTEVLVVNNNIEDLIKLSKKFKPKYIAIQNETKYKELKKSLVGTTCKIVCGRKDIISLAASNEYEFMVSALVGIAGLEPTMAAIRSGKTIGLANKESLVVAGEIMVSEALKHKAKIIPIDSEHSAIFQCLQNSPKNELNKIILTASGGPFYGKKYNFLVNAKVAHAVANPNWSMGKKVSIDSATLLNKGLEMIEAKWLFNLEPNQIEVVIHRQSIIHSLVEFIDGSTLAQLSLPDMRIPIQYALSYPKRLPNLFPRLNWKTLKNLEFDEPDNKTFKCLDLAKWALQHGGNLPCILNAANEIAVEAFLDEKINFVNIAEVIENTLLNVHYNSTASLENYFETDKNSRNFALSILKNYCVI